MNNWGIAWAQACILIEDVAILYCVYLAAKYFQSTDILWWWLLVVFNTIPKTIRDYIEKTAVKPKKEGTAND